MMSAPPAEEPADQPSALGYKVCSSDMASVAQKLEAGAARDGHGDGRRQRRPRAPDDAFTTHLATESEHYNPEFTGTYAEVDLHGAYDAGGKAKRGAFPCFSSLHESILS
jgi:hypothetical protein